MSNAVDITDDTFEKFISEKNIVLVDFWATWCGPCRKLTPVLNEVSSELGDKVSFAKLNTDDNSEMAQKYSVSGLPTLLLFKNGEPVERMVGMLSKSTIISNIEKHLD